MKNLTKTEKVKVIVKMWRELLKVVGEESNSSLMIHDIDFDSLDLKEWEISGSVTDGGNRFWSATPKDGSLTGLTLFE